MKAGATNSKIISKLKAKQPFFSKIFKEKYFKNNSKLILSKNLLGIELEVAFKIDKKIFQIKKVNKKNILKNILSIMPIIELVGGLIVFSFVAWRLIDQFIEKERVEI